MERKEISGSFDWQQQTIYTGIDTVLLTGDRTRAMRRTRLALYFLLSSGVGPSVFLWMAGPENSCHVPVNLMPPA